MPGDDCPCIRPSLPNGTGVWSIDVTDIVEQWVENGSSNYGFFIRCGADSWFIFLSRESNYHPALFIYYTP